MDTLTIGAVIGRLLRIAWAYCLACLATAFSGALLVVPAILAPLLQGDSKGAGGALFGLGYYMLLAPFYALFIGVLALVPAALAIAYAEANGKRSAWFYAAAGAVVANLCAAGYQLLIAQRRISDLSLDPNRIGGAALGVLVLGVLGLIGGLVFWRIAGRTAGAWGRPKQPR